MLIEETFAKNIRRPIDPVVKANSTKNLANDLEEFVITPEVKEHLLALFDEYNDPMATGNGAWISGFYGSGKSHLLKMLAVIMENRQVEGRPALDYVLPKVADVPALQAAMCQAVQRHPSESVLFDIDAIAPNAEKSSVQPLLAAFIKAFNQRRGYFGGDQLHIAKLEEDLDQLGRLGDFRTRVEQATGKPWEMVRKAAILYAGPMSKAFDEVCGNAPGTTQNVITYYQRTYHPSIQSFAQTVAEYIEAHGPGFRLNFFVDEVGQFIAENTSLMTNLQTVAEELNINCHGNSWVVVTSQENMDDIVGEMTSKSGNDFTKIQARFDVKMVLTSQDAKQVIQGRLLDKRDEDEPVYDDLYQRYRGDFPVLFDLADGAKNYRPYRTSEDFTVTYPFVPYQFDLYIAAMRGLSRHNAFTGKYTSTGPRSMLGTFQDVACHLCDQRATTEQGVLATFDMMFASIRNQLQGEVFAAVSTAQDQLPEFEVRVLKALLLVKYVDDFKATPGNLRVLLYGAFGDNTAQLDAKVKAALDELERQSYVRRNGNVYEYLTNEEKDIEVEIKNTPVKEDELRAVIHELWQDSIGTPRVTYQNGEFSHVFPYSFVVDSEKPNARYDLTVQLRTIDEGQRLGVPAQPTPSKWLSITLADAGDFMRGVRTFKQTQTYVNLNSGTGEHREAILSDKREANGKLRAKLRAQLEELVTAARYNVAGVDVTNEVSGSGKQAVEAGARQLVRRSYTSLQQLPRNFKDDEIGSQCLSAPLDGLLPEYANTVLGRVGLLQGSGVQATVAGTGSGSLTYLFGRYEFGWPEEAVRMAVATLFGAHKVEVRKGGVELTDKQVSQALRKKQDLDKLVITKVQEVSAQELAVLNQAYRTVVGQAPSTRDAKQIAEALEVFAKNALRDFEDAQPLVAPYPFAQRYGDQLKPLRELASGAEGTAWVVGEFPKKAAAYAEAKADLNRMSGFAHGNPMQKRWREMRDFLTRAQGAYAGMGLDSRQLHEIETLVNDPEVYRGGQIPHLYKAMKDMEEEAQDKLTQARAQAKAELDAYQRSFAAMEGFDSMDQGSRQQFDAIFARAGERLEQVGSYYQLGDYVSNFKKAHAAELVQLVKPKLEPPEPKPGPTPNPPKDEGGHGHGGDGGEEHHHPDLGPNPVTVNVRDVKVHGYHKPTIDNAADIETYLQAMRQALEAELAQNHLIVP